MTETRSAARLSWRRRLWAYLTNPGVFWWGLPAAVTFALWMHGRDHGFTLRAYWSLSFLVHLIVSVVFIGIFGGNLFGRAMRRHGVDLGVLDGKDRDPPV